jgi:asparagine synthase (glutamine-hydrolysing)
MARKLLPPEFDLNRKQGFSLPVSAWFKGEWGRYIETVLDEVDTRLFDKAVVRRLIADQ